jgi:hypothetical protein
MISQKLVETTYVNAGINVKDVGQNANVLLRRSIFVLLCSHTIPIQCIKYDSKYPT